MAPKAVLPAASSPPHRAAYARPGSAPKKCLAEKGCPESNVWAWNILETARMMKIAVTASSTIARPSCHHGTSLAARRVIIATGAVRTGSILRQALRGVSRSERRRRTVEQPAAR